jgi:toxin ParE1/3/4
VERLKDFPESGRPGRFEGTRELVMTNAPYILPYRILDDRLCILRVLHSARLWPDKLSNNE